MSVASAQLTVDEAAQFAAQLPLVLRGAFYEGFDPTALSDSTDAERALGAATSVLSSHITPGELDDLIAQLPSDLRSVLH
jgi:uncharacterized protein (DUF2267 family)